MKTTDEFPDLPQLESVETRDRDMALLLLIYAGFVAQANFGAVVVYILYGKYIETLGLVGIAALELLTLWLLLRVLFGYSYYRTDPNGLLMKAPLRKRFVDWMDVQRASASRTRAGEPVLELETKSGRVKITPRGFGSKATSGYDIIASAWQHLRRLGRNEGFELPEPALTFWEQIPDDVPREIDWVNRSARFNKIGGLTFLAVVALLFAYLIISSTPIGTLMILTLLVPMLPAVAMLIGPALFRQAINITLREEYLEATLPFGKAYIPWSQVVSACWSANSIVIQSANPRHEVRIDPAPRNRESDQLILAIIRRLRTAGVPQALALPPAPTNP